MGISSYETLLNFVKDNLLKEFEPLPKNQNCRIPISLRPDDVNIKYFKFRLFNLKEIKFIA